VAEPASQTFQITCSQSTHAASMAYQTNQLLSARIVEGHIRTSHLTAGRLGWRASFIAEVNIASCCWLLIHPVAESQLHDCSECCCNICVLLCRCLKVWHVMMAFTPCLCVPLTYHTLLRWFITLISEKDEWKGCRIVWCCLHTANARSCKERLLQH
jgi:hypothetical protein